MNKPTGNETLIAIAVCGTAVIASMRHNEAPSSEIVAMGALFAGIVLAQLGEQRSSSAMRWSGMSIMAIGLVVMVYDWIG